MDRGAGSRIFQLGVTSLFSLDPSFFSVCDFSNKVSYLSIGQDTDRGTGGDWTVDTRHLG